MSFKPLNKKSMNGLILEHLQKGKTITAVEAAALWRVRSLTRRISDIRAKGHVILAEELKDSTGQKYTRYSLVKP